MPFEYPFDCGVCSTRISSKIALEDTPFGMANLLARLMSSLSICKLHSSGNDTGVCFARCTPRTIYLMVLTRLRGYIGFLPVRRTLPNSTHHALATLQKAGVVGTLITQNVDGLHHAALRHILPEPEVDRRILELHGSIFVSPRWFCFPSPSPFESSV